MGRVLTCTPKEEKRMPQRNPRPADRQVGAEESQQRPLTAKERLAAKAKNVVSGGPKKKPRDIIELKDESLKVYADAVDRLAAASHAKKAIEGHLKAAQAIVVPYIRQQVLGEWIQQDKRTENPRVQTPNGSSFIFQCKDTLTGTRGFRVPKDEDGTPVDIRTHLASHGISDELIEQLMVAQEFVQEEVLGINMRVLEKNHPAVSEKILNLILAASEGGVTDSEGNEISFSEEEINVILEKNNDVTVKEGFLDRSIKHVKSVSDGEEEAQRLLERLLMAVPPQWAVGSVNCLRPDETIQRLLHEEPPAAIPVQAPPEFKETADGKYTIKTEGNVLTVYRKTDSKQLAKKICTDPMHATNTVKKWMRDPGSLLAYIAESK
jgi:hypothetical protein